MHNKKLVEGCFVVVWIFPSDLTTELEVAISKPLTVAVLEECNQQQGALSGIWGLHITSSYQFSC